MSHHALALVLNGDERVAGPAGVALLLGHVSDRLGPDSLSLRTRLSA